MYRTIIATLALVVAVLPALGREKKTVDPATLQPRNDRAISFSNSSDLATLQAALKRNKIEQKALEELIAKRQLGNSVQSCGAETCCCTGLGATGNLCTSPADCAYLGGQCGGTCN